MLKKTITYKDWNDTTRTEDFYFNLTRTECAEIEYGLLPGKTLSESFATLVADKDMATVISTIKDILLKSYGVKSDDGRRFIKNQDVRDAFEQNPAFDMIYMELASNAEYAAEFITSIMPKDVTSELGANPKQELLKRMEQMTQ